MSQHPEREEGVDWGSLLERQQLVWTPRVPDEVRGTPKHLRGNLEFLWGGGAALVSGGAILSAVTEWTWPAEAIAVGVIGWLIGVAVAIKLYLVVRRRSRS